ncbi:hypothetical protein CR513_47598, partial [Mucuna pruriens]
TRHSSCEKVNHDKVHSCKSLKKIQWRPQVTTLKASKDLKKIPMEELLGTLKVYKIEINEDEDQRKGKSIALKTQKASKGSLSKAFKVEKSYEKAFKEKGLDKDDFSFISRKICSMWEKKGESKWRNHLRKVHQRS